IKVYGYSDLSNIKKFSHKELVGWLYKEYKGFVKSTENQIALKDKSDEDKGKTKLRIGLMLLLHWLYTENPTLIDGAKNKTQDETILEDKPNGMKSILRLESAAYDRSK